MELVNKLNSGKIFIEKHNSVANMEVHKLVSTSASARVASAAAMSRVPSYANSVGGEAIENEHCII